MTMSGSETGVMNTASIGGMQKSPVVNSPPPMHNISMSFTAADGTHVYQPVHPISGNSLPYEQPGAGGVAGTNGGGGGEGSAGGGVAPSQGINMNMGGDQQKRKRGRPRKYGPDGAMALGLASPPGATPPPATSGVAQAPGAFSPPASQSAQALVAVQPPGLPALPSSAPPMKKARGRPPGSTNKKQHQHHQRQPQRQVETQGQLGIGFTPHVITVQAGEDVSSRIMSFSQHGPRAICILSANGAISNVTLRQAATSGGTVTYEGRFEILSLSGSFMLSESGGQRSRTGGLSISLAGPDGRVLGGGVGGLLIAASPVQVVVASFIAEGQKEPKAYPMETQPMPGKQPPGGGLTGDNSPPSRGTHSESSGGAGSPLNQSSGACNHNSTPQPHVMHGMPWK